MDYPRSLLGEHLHVIGGKLCLLDKSNPTSLVFHELNSVICEKQSDYQHILIVDTKQYGKALVLDGFPQISVGTDPEYTESMVAPALLIHPNPEKVLILGGGDGAALALAYRDPRVKKIVLVDIDNDVITLTQKHIPELWVGTQYDKNTVTILPMDALKYLKESEEFFDVIISDLTDPDEGNCSGPIMCHDYFRLIRAHMYLDSLFAIQSGELTKFAYGGHNLVHGFVEAMFDEQQSYNVYVPWFSTVWSFIIAAKKPGLLPLSWNPTMAQGMLHQNYKFSQYFKYLNAGTLTGLFAVDPAIPVKTVIRSEKNKNRS